MIKFFLKCPFLSVSFYTVQINQYNSFIMHIFQNQSCQACLRDWDDNNFILHFVHQHNIHKEI